MVVYAVNPVVEELRAEARDWLDRPIRLSADDVVRARYAAATHLEDGADVSATDGPTAAMLLTEAVVAMLEHMVRSRGERLPRRKELLATIAVRDPAVGSLANAFFSACTAAERLAAAEAIADRTIGARGFFPWDSGFVAVPSSIT